MLDDDLFGIFVIVLGITVIIDRTLSNYGYEKAMTDLRNILILLIVFILLTFVLFIIIIVNIKMLKHWHLI